MSTWPTIKELSKALRDINREVVVSDLDEACEVRLQIAANGGWRLHWGDPSFDVDHRGHWGASSIPGNGRRFDAETIARDLLEQCRDALALDADDEPTSPGLQLH